VTTDTDHLPCQELVELVNDYLEGLLPAGAQARFEEHLVECPACASYVEQMRLTIAITGRVHSDQLSPEARRSLLETFRGWAGRTDEAATPLPSRERSRQSLRRDADDR
jgi:anti-sigma factor RsiW